MTRSKLLASLLVLIGVCTLASTSFAAAKCPFNGNYSFYFFSPHDEVTGVGYFTVKVASNCRSGVVQPGGIINCNVDDGEGYEDFIEGGNVFLETDGLGTMVLETNSSDGICGTGPNALELDISVANGGKRVLFNSNAVSMVVSGTVPNAGNDYIVTGRAGKCYAGDISGSWDIHFWEPKEQLAGDCTIVLSGGYVIGGSCRCNSVFTEYLSEIETGGYNLGEGCESSTGFLTFTTSSDEVCGETGTVYLDFAAAANGNEILVGCDPDNEFNCAGEGWKQ